MELDRNISAEEVISQLKDEGDFDRLRLKIIRKLKENEELRNNIIAAVKQSAAINRPGAENLKPRQLSDAIHAEIGNQVMGQISDGVWEVIRSSDGMKTEIRETVESVYDRLLHPKTQEVVELSPLNNPATGDKEAMNSTSVVVSTGEQENMSENEPIEPPGITLCHEQVNNSEEENKDGTQLHTSRDSENVTKIKDEPQEFTDDDPSFPPGFAPFLGSNPPGFAPFPGSNQPCNVSDEDPDVPPGFG